MIYTIIIACVIFVLLAIFNVYLKRPETRGKRGENNVKRIIGKTIENEQYVINNLILPHNETTTQIDHVVINHRGIFVIETKNYSGDIYGAENQREWTQVLANGRTQNKLYNPLKQNATHIYCIKQIVGSLPIHSLVVFVQNNTQHIYANNVIPLSLLKRALQSGNDYITEQQMKFTYDTLLTNNVSISTREHVNNIKQQQRNIKNGICPRCGGKLVLRNGKYGQFWGCSNYPKCKFIKRN